MSKNNELLNKMTLLSKLFYMQVRPQIEQLKTELLKTPKQKKAYQALDGTKSIKEIAKVAGYGSVSSVDGMLPEWERKGLILSHGKSTSKKYINIENLEI